MSPNEYLLQYRSFAGPGEQVRVLFAECTSADAGYDAERLNREFAALGATMLLVTPIIWPHYYAVLPTATPYARNAIFSGG